MPRHQNKSRAAEDASSRADNAATIDPDIEKSATQVEPSEERLQINDISTSRSHIQGDIQASINTPPEELSSGHGRSSSPISQELRSEYRKKIRLKLENFGYKANQPSSKRIIDAKAKQVVQKRLGQLVKKYNVLINHASKRSLLVQYPNREIGQEYRSANGQKPLELRIKPKCGVVEVDVPINVFSNFDQTKGIEYGEAMRSSRVLQQGGSYGLGGGLGIGAKPPIKDGRRVIAPDGPSHEKLLENFEDADNKGHVMNNITLGGLIVPFRDGDPIYMTAAFKGGNCIWTKLDAMVQLRPKFDHLDALRDQGKSNSRTDGLDDMLPTDRSQGEARAVNMAVKSADTNDDLDMYGGMSETRKLLVAMRDEPWQRLNWIDQDDDDSFNIYDESLAYSNPENSIQLVSEMTNEHYLDAISCPRIDPMKQGEGLMTDATRPATENPPENGDEDDEVEDLDAEEDTEDGEDEVEIPSGIVIPDIMTQIRIENAVRKICTFTKAKQVIQQRIMQKRFASNPVFARWKFLSPENHDYPYFEWRMEENKAGRAIDPEMDMA